MTAPVDEAELAAMRLVLSSVVARLVLLEASDPGERRKLLSAMSDACKLAAERYPAGSPGDQHARFVSLIIRNIDEFFKGITIT